MSARIIRAASELEEFSRLLSGKSLCRILSILHQYQNRNCHNKNISSLRDIGGNTDTWITIIDKDSEYVNKIFAVVCKSPGKGAANKVVGGSYVTFVQVLLVLLSFSLRH
jgi:hypothetical protein